MALGQPDSEHIDRDGQSLALLLLLFQILILRLALIRIIRLIRVGEYYIINNIIRQVFVRGII